MDFCDVVSKRVSVRSFLLDPVSDDVLKEIVKMASLAPTARNIQPWEFVVIRDKARRQQIADLAPNAPFIATAPVCLAIFCKETKYYLEDGSAATTQALLAVASKGLGACWVAGDKKDYCDQIKLMVGFSKDFRLVSLIAIGFADKTLKRAEKRNVDELIHWEKF